MVALDENIHGTRRGADYSRYRLILISALILFTVLVGLALWTSYSSQIQMRNTARKLFAGESAKRATAVSYFYSRRVAELGSIADGDSVRSLISEDDNLRILDAQADLGLVDNVCSRIFETLAEKFIGSEQVFARIALLDSEGRMLVDTDSECMLIPENSEFKKYSVMYGSPAFFTGDYGGVMTLVVSVPVLGANGKTGTVVGWVCIESLHKSLDGMTLSPAVGSDFLRIGQTIVAVSDASALESGQLLLMDALKEWQGLTVLKGGKSWRKENYLAISSPVHGTSLSVISLVEEQKIFGFVSLQMHLFISSAIFAAVAFGCFFLVRIIFNRHLYEAKVREASLREAAVSRQKEKLEQEIKNRRLADALRHRAEIRYRDIFDNAPVGIFQISLDGQYLTANKSLARIFGYDSQNDLITSVNNVRTDIYVNPEDWDIGVQLLNEIGQVSGYEVECRCKGGETVWTSRDFRLVEAEPGFPSYLEGFVIDVTSRKKAELELSGSEKRFRSLFDDSPVALWELNFSALKDSFDSYGRGRVKLIRDDLLLTKENVEECISLIKVLDTNNLAIRFLKVESKKEMLLQGLAPYVTDQVWRFFRVILLDFASGSTRHRSEVQLTRDDGKGQFLRINCNIVPGYEKSWDRVLASVEDISELKRIEEELRKSKEEAHKANDAKGQFLANMSHEFRTPMSAIKGMVQLLQSSDLSLEQKDNLRLIKSSVDSLLAIVNDILDFSKLDSVHMELNEEALALPSFLQEIRDVMDFGAMNKKLAVKLESEDIPQCVMVDSLRLRQVLVNLLGNAVKFTDAGVVTLKCHPAPTAGSAEKISLIFEVTDTGIGLPVEGAESLFKSFVQADPSITRQYGGTGLGLAICYKLVKLLGGELTARNNASGGASFFFTLTLELCAKAANEGALKEAVTPVSQVVDYSKAKVLVAEDSKMNQILLRKIFEKNGITDYLIVENGKDAVDALTESDDFTIVFMDIQMPIMDGFTACTAIRKLHSPVRIVALSANAGDDFWDKCKECGMDSRILKPFNVEDLLAEIAGTIDD